MITKIYLICTTTIMIAIHLYELYYTMWVKYGLESNNIAFVENSKVFDILKNDHDRILQEIENCKGSITFIVKKIMDLLLMFSSVYIILQKNTKNRFIRILSGENSFLGKNLHGFSLAEIFLVDFSSVVFCSKFMPAIYSTENFLEIYFIHFLIVGPIISIIVLKLLRFFKFKMIIACVISIMMYKYAEYLFIDPKSHFSDKRSFDYTYLNPIVQKRINCIGLGNSMFIRDEIFPFHNACGACNFSGKVMMIHGNVKNENKLHFEAILMHEMQHVEDGIKYLELFNLTVFGILSIFALWYIYLISKSSSTSEKFQEALFIYLIVALYWSFIMPKFKLVLNFFEQFSEFRADLSANEYGYGDHLINGLYELEKYKMIRHTKLFSLLYDEHPCLYERIKNLSE